MSKKAQGLTLLEMVMALFMFAVLVPLFVGVWPIHKRAVKQSQGSLCGNQICRQILEDAVSAGYDGVDALAAKPVVDRTITLNTERSDAKGTVKTSRDFVWQLNVETGATNPALLSGEKLVFAKVSWEEQGKPKSNSMTTLLAESP